MENKILKRIGILFFWLCLWQVLTLVTHNNILIAGPIETIAKLMELMTTTTFWLSMGMSLLRIMAGFFLALLLGICLAILSYKWKLAEEFLAPLMSVLKTIPVASFVVLFLIWFKSDYLSTAVVSVICLPMLYLPFVEALKAQQKDIREMAEVFQISTMGRVFYITIPEVLKTVSAQLQVTMGMAFKSGVASEVIGTPAKSIGLQMYFSKVSLDTSMLLAYTFALIVLGTVAGRSFSLLIRGCQKLRPGFSEAKTMKEEHLQELVLKGLKKSYGEKKVLDGDFHFEKNQKVVLDWPSGSGKTTLFRIIAGLEKADREINRIEGRVAYLFQEDRLLEDESAIANVALVSGNVEEARKHLEKVLPSEDYSKPVKEYSGGMKRRVALVRAMITKCPIVLLDEPFNGLDTESAKLVEAYIEEKRKDRICIVADHRN